MTNNIKKKRNIRQIFKEYAVLLLAGCLQSLGVYVFVQPNSFSPGGFMGLATFANYICAKLELGFSLNTGIAFFIINIPLLIIAARKFRKDFLIKTAVTIVLDSLLLEVLELINFPIFEILPQDGYAYILAAVAGGCLCGASVALLLRVDGCNGGTEIIGALLQKKFPATNISWFIFILDSSVVVLSAFFYDKTKYANWLLPTMLSICKMSCSSKMAEIILRGFSGAIKFEIVTPHGEELGREITETLLRGVTVIQAKGAYTGQDKQVLICIIRKGQLARFKKILAKYPGTFAYMMSTSEVYGNGFSRQAAEGEKESVL